MEHPLPVAWLDPVEGALQQHAGHVDQDVDLSHRLDRVAGHRAHRGVAADVRGEGHRVGNAQLQDFLHGSLHSLRVEIGDDHPSALPRKGVGHSPSEPAGASHDDGDLAGQHTAGLRLALYHSGHSIDERRGQRRRKSGIRGAIA